MHSTERTPDRQEARESLADVADRAATEAMAAGRTISSLVMDEIDRRGVSLAEGLDQISATLRHASAGQDQKSQLVEQAADVIDDLSDRLRQGATQEIGGRLVQYARANPGVVILGALAAGLLAGRMLVADDTAEAEEDADDRLHREGAYERP
ncbi:MAG: hypothetical protein DI533_06110 [Cereibacter sphaeroides]|uniref:Uncharacterized protein n=1 Tax=Cereibacter sphaeroides TaxID=1063 RepID=A0A2W5SAX7_CERSP|nr:MAG: hypothetical protein DI533_06110 [Cereibacter sphaeroides]